MILPRLWVGAFLGVSANFALYLILASEIYRKTNSALTSSLVFASQWVLPVLLVLQIERAGRALDPGRLLVFGALTFAGLTIIAVSVAPVVILVILVCSVFGGLEALMKCARLIALKRYFEGAALKKSVSTLASAMFIGGTVGGAMVAFIPTEAALTQIGVGAVIAHLSSALILVTLPKPQYMVCSDGDAALSMRGFREAMTVALSDRRVFEALFCLIIISGIFQGFHNVARVALPIGHLEAGDGAVGTLQIVSGFAIIIAIFLYRMLFADNDGLKPVIELLSYTCALLMIAPALTSSIAISFSLYFAFIFIYELIFLHYQTHLVVSAQSREISLLSSFQYASINLAMLITVFGSGFLVDNIGYSNSAIALAAIFASAYYFLKPSAPDSS